MTSAANKTRRNIKKQAVEALGGKCFKCGYSKCMAALDFHHVDPAEKEFQISSYRKRDLLLKELKKCVLVCKNCHVAIHQEEREIKINSAGRPFKVCRIHGYAAFYSFKRNGKSNKETCATCMIERQRKAKESLKKDLVDHLGGKCNSCNFTGILPCFDFHHVNGKDRQVSTIKNRAEAFREIEKCVLLCKNCHMETHWHI